MTRRDVATCYVARAQAWGRRADAFERWEPSTLRRDAALLRARAAEAWWLFAASALGYRAAPPSGLELPAAAVLSHGVAVTQCATGHEWPASVTVTLHRGLYGATPRNLRVPSFDVCGDCALALLDAGLAERDL
jgi:hypothetical protein